MQDLYQSVQLISESCVDHLRNFHTQPSKEYIKATNVIEKKLSNYFTIVCEDIASSAFKNYAFEKEQHDALLSLISKSIDNEIKEIQKGEVGNRIGLLQMKLLLETKDLLLTVHSMYLLYHDYHKQAER